MACQECGGMARGGFRSNAGPRIPDANVLAVSADDGMVVLRGSVESFGQWRAAREDARKVEGVYDLDNQLKVDLLDADRREDDEIRGVALQALIWDTEIPSDSVDVKVQDGWITFKGEVTYQFQSDAAYDDGHEKIGMSLGVGEERSRQIEREALHRLRTIATA